MRRKHHEPIPQESLDEPFGPPPEGYHYRCPVCSEERLVNEAIIDVAIGTAQFRGAYRGGACRRLCARDATVRPWKTSLQGPRPPVGRLLDRIGKCICPIPEVPVTQG